MHEIAAACAWYDHCFFPCLDSRKAYLLRNGVDISAGAYLQHDGGTELVSATNLKAPELVQRHTQPMIPPGSSSAFTSTRDRGRDHAESHHHIRKATFLSSRRTLGSTIAAEVTLGLKKLDQEKRWINNKKLPQAERTKIVNSVTDLVLVFKEVQKPSGVTRAWKLTGAPIPGSGNLASRAKKFFLGECSYLNDCNNANEVVKAMVDRTVELAKPGSSRFAGIISEAELSKGLEEHVNERNTARYKKRWASPSTSPGSMRAVQPLAPSWFARKQEVEELKAAAEKAEKAEKKAEKEAQQLKIKEAAEEMKDQKKLQRESKRMEKQNKVLVTKMEKAAAKITKLQQKNEKSQLDIQKLKAQLKQLKAALKQKSTSSKPKPSKSRR